MNAGADRVKSQFANGNTHAICAQIAKARVRSPSVTTITRTCLVGQLRKTFAIRPASLIEI